MKQNIKDYFSALITFLLILTFVYSVWDTNQTFNRIEKELSDIKQYNYSIENKVDTLHKRIIETKKVKRK